MHPSQALKLFTAVIFSILLFPAMVSLSHELGHAIYSLSACGSLHTSVALGSTQSCLNNNTLNICISPTWLYSSYIHASATFASDDTRACNQAAKTALGGVTGLTFPIFILFLLFTGIGLADGQGWNALVTGLLFTFNPYAIIAEMENDDTSRYFLGFCAMVIQLVLANELFWSFLPTRPIWFTFYPDADGSKLWKQLNVDDSTSVSVSYAAFAVLVVCYLSEFYIFYRFTQTSTEDDQEDLQNPLMSSNKSKKRFSRQKPDIPNRRHAPFTEQTGAADTGPAIPLRKHSANAAAEMLGDGYDTAQTTPANINSRKVPPRSASVRNGQRPVIPKRAHGRNGSLDDQEYIIKLETNTGMDDGAMDYEEHENESYYQADEQASNRTQSILDDESMPQVSANPNRTSTGQYLYNRPTTNKNRYDSQVSSLVNSAVSASLAEYRGGSHPESQYTVDYQYDSQYLEDQHASAYADDSNYASNYSRDGESTGYAPQYSSPLAGRQVSTVSSRTGQSEASLPNFIKELYEPPKASALAPKRYNDRFYDDGSMMISLDGVKTWKGKGGMKAAAAAPKLSSIINALQNDTESLHDY